MKFIASNITVVLNDQLNVSSRRTYWIWHCIQFHFLQAYKLYFK